MSRVLNKSICVEIGKENIILLGTIRLPVSLLVSRNGNLLYNYQDSIVNKNKYSHLV